MRRYKPAKYYYDRAAEARAIARVAHSSDQREVWENIAKGFRALGDHIDAQHYDLEKQVAAALRVDGCGMLPGNNEEAAANDRKGSRA